MLSLRRSDEIAMTVKLGMFTMPFHHHDRDCAAVLAEVR
jgi:hypothetical protein